MPTLWKPRWIRLDEVKNVRQLNGKTEEAADICRCDRRVQEMQW